MPKRSSKNNGIPIRFLGCGSYNTVKTKNSTQGIFWTIDSNNKYIVLEVKGSKSKVTAFDTYSDMVKFCQKTFPDSDIYT